MYLSIHLAVASARRFRERILIIFRVGRRLPRNHRGEAHVADAPRVPRSRSAKDAGVESRGGRVQGSNEFLVRLAVSGDGDVLHEARVHVTAIVLRRQSNGGAE